MTSQLEEMKKQISVVATPQMQANLLHHLKSLIEQMQEISKSTHQNKQQ